MSRPLRLIENFEETGYEKLSIPTYSIVIEYGVT